MKKTITTLLSLAAITQVFAQHTVSGHLAQHTSTEIRLKGFNGFTERVFSQDIIASDGNFSLAYPHDYIGMGAIEVKEQGSLLLILTHENVELSGTHIQDYQNIKITNSPENQYFDSYILQQGIRNKKLDGWKWLKPIYQLENNSSATLSYINNEIATLEAQEAQFLNDIPNDKYAAYFLPLRKLIEDRTASVNRYVERVPQHIKDFNSYDLTSKNLWQSGLMQQFYEGHFIMLENVYSVSDSAYQYMEQSIDHIIYQLSGYDDKLLEVAEHLFKFFEKRSLYPAAEYLSLKMLEQNSCTVEGELARRFEQYKTMKEGNKAPNIVFEDKETHIVRGFKNNEKTLYDINSKYKLVVFWASWCSHCMEEMPKLQSAYAKLQNKEVEVVSIALDTDRQAFLSASASYPWYSYTDFKKWNGTAVLDYYVFATPSFYLLDEQNVILKKITSIAQLETIVDTFLE